MELNTSLLKELSDFIVKEITNNSINGKFKTKEGKPTQQIKPIVTINEMTLEIKIQINGVYFDPRKVKSNTRDFIKKCVENGQKAFLLAHENDFKQIGDGT